MAETRVRVVRVLGMELNPRARCLGELDAQGNVMKPCSFRTDHGDDSRRRAKGHAAHHLTHTVRVIRESFDDYQAEA